MSDKYVIEIKKRPWYEWSLWAGWLIVELALLQMAVASKSELEPRAQTLFWISFFVILIGGAVVWYMRRTK
jgi:hypothetical protein